MRRYLGMVVIACGVACWTATSSSATSPTGSAMVIGDSVSALIEEVPAAAYALGNGLAVSADLAVCRRLVAPSCTYKGTQPPTALEQIESLPRTPRVVVLDVGYNDNSDTFIQDAATVTAALVKRGVGRVVWVTLREERSSYADSNNAIRTLAKRWPTVIRIADWNATSAGQPWFEPDGLHLNPLGAEMLAQLIHSNLVAACNGGCSLPSRPLLQPIPAGAKVCTEGAGGAWAAILATARSASGALALQRRAIAAGFGQSVIVQPSVGAYEIVLFGFTTRAAAIDYYLQARLRGFRLTVAPNIDACGDENGGWKAVFGHTATLPAAKQLLTRIRAVGFRDGSGIQSTGLGDHEVVVAGIQSTKQFTGFANEALKAGYIVSFKPD